MRRGGQGTGVRSKCPDVQAWPDVLHLGDLGCQEPREKADFRLELQISVPPCPEEQAGASPREREGLEADLVLVQINGRSSDIGPWQDFSVSP